ncbi:MAG TPA: transposase [Pyrinomonadaceae bacterium]|nr:transposase [Pyrinomonadaceae bacterium]
MSEQKRYYRRSRIPESKFCELVRYFAQDLSATEVANLTGVTRKSVTTIFLKMRRRIAEQCERSSPLFTLGLRQKDEFSCVRCVCGRCRTKASARSPVFGVLADSGKVFTAAIPDCQKPILRAMVRGRIAADNMPSNGWHGYDALVDAEYAKPFIVKRSAAEAAEFSAAGVESFWGFAKARLEKFYGVPNRTFYLHLKETEWRFNLGQYDLYGELLKLMEKHPL